jgi:hypothetical protein
MTTRAYKATGVFTDDDVLEILADNEALFSYELFLEAAGLPPMPREMPPEHWQAALKHRTLTPQEQAARERYFQRRTHECLRRVPAGK